MPSPYGRIAGWGAYTPHRILTNVDLAGMVDTSDEWIVQRSGIRERRIAAPHETTSSMAVNAARRALAQPDSPRTTSTLSSSLLLPPTTILRPSLARFSTRLALRVSPLLSSSPAAPALSTP